MMAAEWLRTTLAPFDGDGCRSRDLPRNRKCADRGAGLVTA